MARLEEKKKKVDEIEKTRAKFRRGLVGDLAALVAKPQVEKIEKMQEEKLKRDLYTLEDRSKYRDVLETTGVKGSYALMRTAKMEELSNLALERTRKLMGNPEIQMHELGNYLKKYPKVAEQLKSEMSQISRLKTIGQIRAKREAAEKAPMPNVGAIEAERLSHERELYKITDLLEKNPRIKKEVMNEMSKKFWVRPVTWLAEKDAQEIREQWVDEKGRVTGTGVALGIIQGGKIYPKPGYEEDLTNFLKEQISKKGGLKEAVEKTPLRQTAPEKGVGWYTDTQGRIRTTRGRKSARWTA